MANAAIAQLLACDKCQQKKPASREFFHTSTRPSGFRRICKVCANAHRRFRARMIRDGECPDGMAWVKPNHRVCTTCLSELPERRFRVAKVRDKMIPRSSCRDCEASRNRAYLKAKYGAKREFVLERNAKWRMQNSEKVCLSQAAYKPDPEARKANCDRYRAKRAKVEGEYTASDVRRILSDQRRRCYYCEQRLKLYHVDHFIPLSRGGSNWPDNIVIACETCNYEKRAKMPWEWKPGRFVEGATPR